MSELWDSPGVPHKGWRFVDLEDLGEPCGSCEMCGKEMVRYLHLMQHPEFPDVLSVGCVCAAKMEEDYAAPRKRETLFKNRVARRAKWLTRKWRISGRGNEFLNVKGHNVVISPDRYGPGRWKYSIDNEFDRRSYPTSNDAKLAAFDALWPKEY